MIVPANRISGHFEDRTKDGDPMEETRIRFGKAFLRLALVSSLAVWLFVSVDCWLRIRHQQLQFSRLANEQLYLRIRIQRLEEFVFSLRGDGDGQVRLPSDDTR